MSTSSAEYGKMPRIDMWDWLESIPEKTYGSRDSSMSSSPHQLKYTTFPELHNYALDNEKVAYQALPHHFLLRFESVDQDTLGTSPRNAVVTNSRLLLGLSKHGYKGESNAAYAYICKKNQVHQMLLRIGTKHLKAKDFEDVEWEKPFDSIYDAYGQTERAGDKISIMAAFYFLATNRIPEITTRTDFSQNFAKLCGKIHVQETEQVDSRDITTDAEHFGDLYKDQNLPSKLLGHPSGENCASDRSPLATQQQGIGPKQGPADEVFQNTQEILDTQLIDITYEIDNTGDRATNPPINDHASNISSPTVWEGLRGSPVGQLSRSNNDLLLDHARAVKEKPLGQFNLQIPAEASQPVEAATNAVNIDVLAAFVGKFKELEAAVADQQGLISQSKDAAKQAYTQVQTLQERCLNQQTEMKELREELAGTKTDCASQCQKLTFELGQEQWKLQLAQRSHDQTQKKLDVVQAEKKHLEHRFADAEQSRASKQKLAAMESSLQALEGSNKTMQDTIKSLESEVREEKTKLNDYKRKIRNLSMGP